MSRAGAATAACGLALAALLAPAAASAHAPLQGGLGGFYAGALHPVLVPAHVLALLGLGLLLGQRWRAQGEVAVAAFAVALVAGLALGHARPVPVSASLAALAALAGGLAAAEPPALPRVAVALLASATGLALGLDSPPEAAATGRDAALVLAGTAAGAGASLVVVAGLASEASRVWQRLGLRVLGSWVAASAVLVLALAAAPLAAPGR